jgi:glycosyltransferase involved in cell wall biosynthesis
MKYILTTPVKNEESSLPKLIDSITNQSILPALWVIIDDGSTDNTPIIIENAKTKYDWIQSLRLNKSRRDVGKHLSEVIRNGFEFAINYCRQKKIDFYYLGNVDGDLYLEEKYFEKIMACFRDDPNLGIASGGEWFLSGDEMINRKMERPYGGAPLIKKECYEKCNGIPISYAWDSVMNAKAIIKGWTTASFNDVKYFSPRVGCSAEGLWRGYIQRGNSDYFLGFNPFHALLKSVKLPFLQYWSSNSVRPYHICFAYLYGYFSSLILQKEQIREKEIRSYYRYVRFQEIYQRYYTNLKKIV